MKPINTDNNGLIRDNKGRFLEGNRGKPKGAVNKTTKELKQMLVNFIADKQSELHEIWDSLDNKDKASMFIHLSKLVVSSKEEITQETPIPPINLIVNNGDTAQAYKDLIKMFEDDEIEQD